MTIFLISWAITGVLSAFVFWLMNVGPDSKFGKLAFTCVFLMFLGYASVVFTGQAGLADYKINQIETWWKSIGVLKQAELCGISGFNAIRSGGVNASIELKAQLYAKAKKAGKPEKVVTATIVEL